MTANEFSEWATNYSTVFALRTTEEQSTVAAWQDIFNRAGYTLKELMEATRILGASPEMLYGNEARFAGKMPMHLAAITREVRQQRAVLRDQERPSGQQGMHTLCGSTGRVVVPHKDGIKDGEWVPIRMARGGATYYTMAVLCSCPLGKFIGQSMQPDKRLMSLEQYERRNHDWERQMKWRQDELQARAQMRFKGPQRKKAPEGQPEEIGPADFGAIAPGVPGLQILDVEPVINEDAKDVPF